MGKGIDLARSIAPEHAALMDDLKDQLVLVLVKRLGGKVSLPISEVDNTGGHVLLMSVESGVFHLELQRKQ